MQISRNAILIYFFLGVIHAQLSITNLDANQYVVDFDNTVANVNLGQFDGTFPHANPQTGDLDADAWVFKRTVTLVADSAYFGGEDNGGVTSGLFYAFDISNGGVKDNALGFQPTTDFFTPGSITLKMVNNTGSTITHITVDYEIWVYNSASRGNTLAFSHSPDGNTFTDETSLTYTSPEAADPSPAWVSVSKGIWLQNLSIPDGSAYYIRWTGNDSIGSGGRDEFAIDDITISMGTALNINPSVLPDKSGLYRSYPNPFNSFTMINYTIAEFDDTQLTLLDITGKPVRTLVNGYQTPGNYEYYLDAADFPSGIYFVRLSTSRIVSTQKITLLK